MKEKITNTLRWQMFACLFVAGYLAIVGMHTKADMLQLSPVIFSFLGWGTGAGAWNEYRLKKEEAEK